MFGLLGGQKPSLPERVPTDEVLPVYSWDDHDAVRMAMSWILRYDDVLDADKLHESLKKLLNTGNWRKLRGRMRLTQDGKGLEVHVPESVSEERPAVGFHHFSFDMAIDEHPKAHLFPAATERPSTQDHTVLEELAGTDRIPRQFSDWLYSDEPLLQLRIFSFRDATVLVLGYPHPVMDGMGRRSLIANWAAVAAGREDEVQELSFEDIMSRAGAEKPDEELLVLPWVLRGFAWLRWVVNFMWSVFFGPPVSHRLVFFPAQSIARLKQRAVDDLMDSKIVQKRIASGEPKPFISEGDAVCSWFVDIVRRTVASGRGVMLLYVCDMRSRLPDVFDQAKVYMSNCVTALNIVYPKKIVASMSLGEMALYQRERIAEQATQTQLRALLHFNPRVKGAMFGEPDSLLVVVSNAAKGGHVEAANFSSVVVRRRERPAGQEDRVGKPVSQFMVTTSTKTRFTMNRNLFSVSGKDLDGNLWCGGIMAPESWEELERELKRL